MRFCYSGECGVLCMHRARETMYSVQNSHSLSCSTRITWTSRKTILSFIKRFRHWFSPFAPRMSHDVKAARNRIQKLQVLQPHSIHSTIWFVVLRHTRVTPINCRCNIHDRKGMHYWNRFAKTCVEVRVPPLRPSRWWQHRQPLFHIHRIVRAQTSVSCVRRRLRLQTTFDSEFSISAVVIRFMACV